MNAEETTTAASNFILLRPERAAATLDISRSHFDSLVSAGAIGPKPICLGKLKLWPRHELERWAAAGCPGRVEWLNMQDK